MWGEDRIVGNLVVVERAATRRIRYDRLRSMLQGRLIFPAKLPSGPARKERETTDRTPKTRSETSRATWGWPKACEGQGHGGVIVLSHQKLFF